MKEDKLVSVVICTRNRADQLEKALLSWCSADTEGIKEIIVVDNGSEDETYEVVKAISDKSNASIKYSYEGVAGLSAARNNGLALAGGEIISFTDDDCYPAKDFVPEVLKVFNADPKIGFVGGRVLLFDKTDLPITIQTNEKVIEFPINQFFKAGLIHGANLSVKADQVKPRFLFDQRFGAGSSLESAEDTDFLARLLWNQVPGIYHPGPTVYHHHGRKEKASAKKLHRGYAIGRGAYYMKFLLCKRTRSAYANHFYSELRRDFDKQRLLEMWGAVKFLKLKSAEAKEWSVDPI